MKRFALAMLFVTVTAVVSVFTFNACRSGGLSSTLPSGDHSADDDVASDDDTSPDDDTYLDDDTYIDDDTSPDDDASPDDDSAADDDDNDDNDNDDDVSPGETALAGLIKCLDCTGSYVGKNVKIYLYTNWLPNGSQPVATQAFQTPTGGFPFTYAWNLDAAGVASGNYYVFAFVDVVGDGIIDPSLDPYESPFLPTPVTHGETTYLDIALVPPQSARQQ